MPRSKGRLHLQDPAMTQFFPKQIYFYCGPPFKSTNPKTNRVARTVEEATCVSCINNYQKRATK